MQAGQRVSFLSPPENHTIERAIDPKGFFFAPRGKLLYRDGIKGHSWLRGFSCDQRGLHGAGQPGLGLHFTSDDREDEKSEFPVVDLVGEKGSAD